jgi:hypothetical protein
MIHPVPMSTNAVEFVPGRKKKYQDTQEINRQILREFIENNINFLSA